MLGVASLLKTGLGSVFHMNKDTFLTLWLFVRRLGIKSTRRPDANRLIVLFVVGGISAAEVQSIRKLVEQQNRVQIVVGSTALANADSIFCQTLLHDAN